MISGSAARPPTELRAPQDSSQGFLGAPVGGCYLGNGYLAVADKALPTYSIWQYNPDSPRTQTCRFVGYGPPGESAFNFSVRGIAYDAERRRMAYIGTNFPLRDAVFFYVKEVNPHDETSLIGGQPGYWMRIPLVGWLENPAGLAFGPDGDLFITDAGSDSIQKIGRESFVALDAPARVDVQRTRAMVSYRSIAEVRTELEYGSAPGHLGAVGSLARTYSDPATRLDHRAQLTDLFPSSRYAYRYLLSRDVFSGVPGSSLAGYSQTRFFVTEPAQATTAYVSFPFTVLFFTGTTGDASDPMQNPEVARAESQLESARLFFWVNSRMACNLKPNLVLISERPEGSLLPSLKELKTGVGQIAALEKFLRELNDVESLARRRGIPFRKDPAGGLWSSRNIFMIAPAEFYDEGVRDFLPVTCGLDRLGGAVSIFVQTHDDCVWFFIKEFYKQLSIMHLASGTSDELSRLSRDARSDQSMVRWDSAADLARALGRQVWLSNLYGVFRTAADDDEDAVPDDEPDCPLDEKRFGTSPRAKDSDGDRVADLDETLFSRWARDFPVEGTRVMENHARPRPSSPDTDADGVLDAVDRNPLSFLGDFARRLDIVTDGKISQGEWDNAPRLRIADGEYSGVLRVGWTQTHLCFSLTGVGRGVSQGPPFIRIRLDGTADGFLRGSDNVTLLFEPSSDGSFNVRQVDGGFGPVSGTSRLGASWPDLAQVLARWSLIQESLQLEIALPKSPVVGLNLFGEEEVAFDFEVGLPRSAEAKEPAVWLRVFEPLTLFRARLIRPREEVEMPD